MKKNSAIVSAKVAKNNKKNLKTGMQRARFFIEIKDFLGYILGMNLAENQVKAEDWNHSVIERGGSFLQSWEWGEFQRSLGRKIFYLKDGEWQALAIKYRLPLGKNYLYCPRVILGGAKDLLHMRDYWKELAKKEKSIFVRFEPFFCHFSESGNSDWISVRPLRHLASGQNARDDRRGQELKEIGFVKTKDIQPAKTLVLDLALSKEELFKRMHEKTRYNISLAERKGVRVRKTEYNEKDFEAFWQIMNLTAKRQGIRVFPKEYYRKQMQIGKNLPQPLLSTNSGQAPKEGSSFSLGMAGSWTPSGLSPRDERLRVLDSNEDDFKNLLFVAEFEGKPVAANVLNIFGKTATYLHGGSDNEFRSLMAPHLLQWEQIKEAKAQGCAAYDFWGYDEQKWPGISRFKRGFGGREIRYPGCFDYPIDKKWVFIYKLARKIL